MVSKQAVQLQMMRVLVTTLMMVIRMPMVTSDEKVQGTMHDLDFV